MKKWIFAALFALVGVVASAQNYIVVNSEKVFKSITAYNNAISELDKLAQAYQDQVEQKYEEVEELYNTYQQQKASLTSTTRQSFENVILTREKEAGELQESLFGEEGALMKRRIEMIKPIQEQVFAIIEAYAKEVGAELVLDSANNPTLLYNAASVERTQQIINRLK